MRKKEREKESGERIRYADKKYILHFYFNKKVGEYMAIGVNAPSF